MPDEERFNSLRWLAASLSSAVAIVVMQVTQTTHPPAGATALLPAIDDAIWELSWYYLPVVLLSSVILTAVAVLLNNIQRRYPTFWISPKPPAPAPPVTDPEQQKQPGGNVVRYVVSRSYVESSINRDLAAVGPSQYESTGRLK